MVHGEEETEAVGEISSGLNIESEHLSRSSVDGSHDHMPVINYFDSSFIEDWLRIIEGSEESAGIGIEQPDGVVGDGCS